jgi:hypothetical protein
MRKPRKTAKMSATRAAALSSSAIDLACSPDADDVGAPFTRLLRLRSGEWTTLDIPQHTESMCQFRDPAGNVSLYVMSREGDLLNVESGVASKVEDVTLRGSQHQLGFLNKLRQVGATLYAVGAGGQAYRREANGGWRVLDRALLDGPRADSEWILEFARNPALLEDPGQHSQLLARLDRERAKLFWALAGEAEDAIYVCGERTDGLLYLWNGVEATACALPASGSLRDILIAPDGAVWICGRDGLVLRGRGRNFNVVLDLGHEPRFASLAWFEDRLYLGSSSGPHALYVLNNGEAAVVRTGLSPEPEDAHTIEAVDGVLWIVGMKELVRFDGRRWDRIPVPGVRA